MKLNAIFLILAVAIAGGLVWYSTTSQTETVPIIRADKTPIKERPSERGGMNIAHKDSTIYDAMRQETSQRRVENLLAENQASRPVNREELFAGLKPQQSSENNIIQELKNDETVESRIAGSIPLEPEDTKERSTASQTDEIVSAPNPDETKDPEPEFKISSNIQTSKPVARPNAVKKTKESTQQKDRGLNNLLAEVQGLKIEPLQSKQQKQTTSFKAGKNYIQIGSLKSESAAQKHWDSRKKQFPTLLKNFSLRIQKIEIEGRGAFYRVQGGPASKETAKNACSKINARYANSCIVK